MKSYRTTTAGIVAAVAVAVLTAGEVFAWGLSDELRALLFGAAGLALSGGLLAARDATVTSEGTDAVLRQRGEDGG